MLIGGEARNLGWQSAQTEIVFFLDDDDYWLEDKVRLHLAAHENSQADVVYSGVVDVSNDGRRHAERPARAVPGDLVRAMEQGFCPPTTSAVSIRRNILLQVQGFDERLQSYQDWDLWYRVALAGCKFAVVHRPLTAFVQHDGERVSVRYEERKQASEYLIKKHTGRPEIARFVKIELKHTCKRSLVAAMNDKHRNAFDEYRAHIKSGDLDLLSMMTLKLGLRIAAAHSGRLFR